MTTPVRLRRTRARPRADMADPLHGQRHPRVVVVGGGFGGLAAVHGLRSSDADVTLIDRHPDRCRCLPIRFPQDRW